MSRLSFTDSDWGLFERIAGAQKPTVHQTRMYTERLTPD